MDFEQISRSLLPLLGGKENIASAAHCATRLRLVLVDDALADQQAIGKIEGVKGCFRNAGQMQIIFGTGVVNKVYAAFIQAAGISESSKSEAADIAAKKLNPFQRIARLLSNIFVPIIPAIVASGLLMGLLGMVKTYGWVDPSNALYIMLDMCSSAAFIILPILIGFTAAREFGGNPYLGATLGGILTHPALTNAWGVAAGFHTMNFFGLEIAMIGYQGTVFPVLLAVWFMSIVEKQLRRAIPDALDLILTPFLTVIISGFIALLIIGPAGRALGDGISFVLSTLISHAGWLAGLLLAVSIRLSSLPVFTTASTPSKPGCWATRPSGSTSCCRSGPWPTSPRAAPAWRYGLKPKTSKSKPSRCLRRFPLCWASPRRRFLVSTYAS
ncbi:PTS system protein [Klebsiella michiganensis]|nr:PTS system protein [Klebsiella michiganensis]